MDVGDWMYWENMGAYTVCAASQFNGFKKSEIHYTNTFI
jgi:ornithine decarboxylase